MASGFDLPVMRFRDAAAWEAWLEANGAAAGVWLKIAKKGQGVTSVSYVEAVDVALCHGWIDGQKKAFDAAYFAQRFTPRRPRSLWSKINVEKVQALHDAGRMRPAGLRQVEAAKADGRWQAAYSGARDMSVPEELLAALARNKKARTAFEALDRINRYAVCWRVQTARKAETRQARIAALVAMLEEGGMIHG